VFRSWVHTHGVSDLVEVIVGPHAGRYTHLLRCRGGQLDGRTFQITSDHCMPHLFLRLPVPGGGQGLYSREPMPAPFRSGDTWTYSWVTSP
jgi:hypothetical protein